MSDYRPDLPSCEDHGPKNCDPYCAKCYRLLRAKYDDALLQIQSLKGRCLSEIDHGMWCEEELKIKDQWCEMCRALAAIGISQLEESDKRVCCCTGHEAGAVVDCPVHGKV